MRIRRGNTGSPVSGASDQNLDISSGSGAGSPSSATVSNVIADHNSFGWQQDDNVVWGKEQNITLQWNIFAEGNNPSGSSNGINGKGLVVGTPPAWILAMSLYITTF
jgi:hypothetical protein